jgi:hypothetical protein
MQDETRQLRLKIRELCIYLHSENSGYSNEEEFDSNDLSCILQLSPMAMLTYVRTKAQSVFQQSRSDQEVKSCQAALQQLRSDSRRRAEVTFP